MPTRRIVSLSILFTAVSLLGAASSFVGTIQSVTFTGTAGAPVITIDGSGFDPEPAVTSIAMYGFDGLDFGTSLHITDPSTTPLFDAGYDDPSHGYHDILGLFVLNYSDNEITYRLGSNYATFNSPLSPLQFSEGDIYTVYVNGASFTGVVDYVPEPFTGAMLAIGLTAVLSFRRLLWRIS